MDAIKMLWWTLLASRVAAEGLGGASLLSLLLRSQPVDGVDGIGEVCRNRTDMYKQALDDKETWALMMLDASTKIPEGLMVFTTTHLGNFDECLMVQGESASGEPINSQYCLVSVKLGATGAKAGVLVAADELSLDAGNHRLMRMKRDVTYFGTSSIKMAVCLPVGCSAAETALFMQEVLKPVIGANTTVSANPLECQTADEPKFRGIDWMAVGILIFFAVLVCLSTSYDLLQRNEESRNNLLLAFSVYSNGKRLLATTSSGDTLHALHGIRFVSICWVVMGHRYSMAVALPVMNIAYLADFMKDWTRLGVMNATLAVDSFFVLSGLLVAYVFFKQVPKANSFNVLLYYVHRFIRLTPALAVVVLLHTTLLQYGGSGPLWKSFNVPMVETCEKNWWATVLYVNNYVNPASMCVRQSWYLAVDMQLFWLSPLVLVPLWKWPLIGRILLGVFSLGGLITSFTIAYLNEYPTIVNPSADYNNNFYYPTHTRFVPYLIGIALGYILVKVKEQPVNVTFHKLMAPALWGVAAALMLLSLFIIHPFNQPDYVPNLLESTFYNCLGRPVWSLGVAVAIFLCSTGHGGYANTLLSWEPFQPLSRLTYCIYLTHLSVISAQGFTVRTLIYLGDINTIPALAGDIVISIFFAACLSLVFESPFIVIEKSLLGGRSKRTAKIEPAPVEQEQEKEQEHHPEELSTTNDTKELV